MTVSKEHLQDLHSKLSRARYFYYEKSESIMSDYEYDMLEKEYEKLCDLHNIPQEKRITNFVGFSIYIPRLIF